MDTRHFELVSQLVEYANEYEIGTPTGDMFLEAAATIAALYIQIVSLQELVKSLREKQNTCTARDDKAVAMALVRVFRKIEELLEEE